MICEKFKKDSSSIIAIKKLLVASVQRRIYERSQFAKFKFGYVYWVVFWFFFIMWTDWIWTGYHAVLWGGFLGGQASGLGVVTGDSFFMPCGSMDGRLSGMVEDEEGNTKYYWEPLGFDGYHTTCREIEAEIWMKYLSPAVFKTCANPVGARDLFSTLFLWNNTENTKNECDTTMVPLWGLDSNYEDFLSIPDQWDVGIMTDPIGDEQHRVQFPMVTHTSLGSPAPLSPGLAADTLLLRPTTTMPQSLLNQYEPCTLSPELVGGSFYHSNVTYFKKKDQGGCSEDRVGELAEHIGEEYERLGGDAVNRYVRDKVLERWKDEKGDFTDEKGDFTVLDVGSGLGGTMYALAARGHLNPLLSRVRRGKEGSEGGKSWGGWLGSNKKEGNLKYIGVSLSSAEVVLAKREARKRNLEEPFVTFDQISYDEPGFDFEADAVIAIESLSFSHNPLESLKNISKTMSPGTTLIVVDHVRRGSKDDRESYMAQGSAKFTKYLSSEYNPNLEGNSRYRGPPPSRRPKAKNPFSPNSDKSVCIRNVEEADKRRLLNLPLWLANFREAGFWVEDVEDLSTLYGGDHEAAGVEDVPWGSKERIGRFIWEMWIKLQSGLSYLFGNENDEIIDGPDIYLSNAAWHIRRCEVFGVGLFCGVGVSNSIVYSFQVRKGARH
ncbi:hypothetical protein TL16_g10188 [Triparma laevis f. inornata]|uniref:Methyltransferase type 11 domain-containing protein n=1 Tax=Triparma laevis f. inornata TaxID=1714386 RepID=A0A9W7BC98_9STRA|nr:hypothetical protein TL16_g10188 [Triparma laevis f. inornata]